MQTNIPSGQHRQQQGVVLIVVLIMLVIIGLTSAAVMRNALTTDLVSGNVRSETLATEAAQLALSYCEQQLLKGGAVLVLKPADAEGHWSKLDNWLDGSANGPISPPNWGTRDGSGSASASAGSKAPQCMAEQTTLPGGAPTPSTDDIVVTVTARGFTPDYKEDTTKKGQVISGSAVWLQSTLRLKKK
ncbi:MAG: hypothetical protein C0487_13800 [Leptothrix sp. (in: Bacteria)]|nr:hypothetical protein [Leptothrix sp. (in: b-proteobacteria)]